MGVVAFEDGGNVNAIRNKWNPLVTNDDSCTMTRQELTQKPMNVPIEEVTPCFDRPALRERKHQKRIKRMNIL